MNAPPRAPAGTSTAMAVFAAFPPIMFHVAAAVLLFGLTGGPEELAYQFQAGGWGSWAVVGTALGAALLNTVLLPVAVKWPRLPAALPLAVATLPWITGLLGVVHGMTLVEEAIVHVNPADKATIMAAGISEALVNMRFGAWFAGAQLAAAAVGLGLGVVGQRAPSRREVGALAALGGLAAIPVIAFSVPALGPGALSMLLPAVSLMVALALGGLGAGADARGRSGALAATGALAGLLALGATGVFNSASGLIDGFGALAHVAGDDKGFILVSILSDQLVAWDAFRVGLAAAGLGVGAVVLHALRLCPHKGSLAASVALGAALCVGTAVADRSVSARAMGSMGRLLSPQVGSPGLQPLALRDGQPVSTPELELPREGGLRWTSEGKHAGPAVELEALRGHLVRAPPRWEAPPEEVDEDHGVPKCHRPLVISVDARASPASLRTALALVEQAGGTCVDLHGDLERTDVSGQERVIAAFPFLPAMLQRQAAVRFFLPAAATSPGEEARLRHLGLAGVAPAMLLQAVEAARDAGLFPVVHPSGLPEELGEPGDPTVAGDHAR